MSDNSSKIYDMPSPGLNSRNIEDEVCPIDPSTGLPLCTAALTTAQLAGGQVVFRYCYFSTPASRTYTARLALPPYLVIGEQPFSLGHPRPDQIPGPLHCLKKVGLTYALDILDKLVWYYSIYSLNAEQCYQEYV